MMICPKCGTQNRAGAKFCIGCGELLPSSSRQTSQPQKKWPVVGLVVAIVAVGLAAYIFGSQSIDGQPTPTSGPTRPVTPSPTPDARLFWDDFETGIKADWHMRGDNFNAVNGRLVSAGALIGGIGDYTWTDYRVVLTGWSISRYVTLRFRVQDENNYMEMRCGRPNKRVSGCRWYKVSDGEAKEVPGTEHRHIPRRPSIELKDNMYRVVDLETSQEIVKFADDTVSFG